MTEVEYGAWERSRHVARKYAQQADQAATSAQAASVRGDKAQVIKFSRLVMRCSRCRDNHNRIAAELIFRFHNNRLDDETIIDLHYLRASEAVNVLLERIEALIINGKSNLDVIVGRGLHSTDGPKIRPTVISLAEHCSIPYKISTTNPGLIHLFLPDNLLETMNMMTTFYFDPEKERVNDGRKPVTLDQFLVVKKHRKGRKGSISSVSEINREECSSGSTSKTKKSRRRRSRKKKTKTDSVTISQAEPPSDQVLSLVESESSSAAGMYLKVVSTSTPVDTMNESEHCEQPAMLKRFTIFGRFAALCFILFVLIYTDVLQPEYIFANYGLEMMSCYREDAYPSNSIFLDGMNEIYSKRVEVEVLNSY